MWCRQNSDKDEKFFRQVQRDNPGIKTPLDDKPRLMEAARPVLDAYNFVVTWADGFGGMRRGDLEWYLSKGDGGPLSPRTKEMIRVGVRRLIAQDRRLAAEEMKRAAGK